MKKLKFLVAFSLLAYIAQAQVIFTYAGNGLQTYSGDGGFAMTAGLNNGNNVGTISGLVCDAAGNLYFSDLYNERIRKISTNGVISLVAGSGVHGFAGDNGSAIAAQFRYPSGIAIDGSGNLYVADSYNNRIRKIIPGGIITTIAGNGVQGYGGDSGPATAANLNQPSGVTIANGSLYIADCWNNAIRKVDLSTGIITTVAGTGVYGNTGDGGAAISATLRHPQDVKFDLSGNTLYISDSDNNRIRVVSNGIINGFAGTGTAGFFGDNGAAAAARFYSPHGLAVDASGNVYISDTGNNRIRKVTSGIITTVAGSGTPGFSGDGGSPTVASLQLPTAVTLDVNNNLYIDHGWGNRIRSVSSICPANAGPNVINQQDICGTWPGVQIGTPAIPNMIYSWSPNSYLSSATIAQPISSWSVPNTSKLYTVRVSNKYCTTSYSAVGVTALPNNCPGCCRLTSPLTEELRFSVYPSPGNGNVTVGLYNNAEYIRVMDMLGRVVFETENISTPEFKLDISSYTRGIYVVTAKIGDAIEKQKIIVE